MMMIANVTINDHEGTEDMTVNKPAWQIIRLISELSERRPRPTSLVITLVWSDKS